MLYAMTEWSGYGLLRKRKYAAMEKMTRRFVVIIGTDGLRDTHGLTFWWAIFMGLHHAYMLGVSQSILLYYFQEVCQFPGAILLYTRPLLPKRTLHFLIDTLDIQHLRHPASSSKVISCFKFLKPQINM